MNNLDFKNWVLQEAFGSFKYQFPINKLQQMADFYALQMLSGRTSFDLKRQQLISDKGEDSYQFGKPRSMDDQPNKEDQLDYVLKEIVNEFIPKLKEEILEDVLFSIISEARHATDANGPKNILNAIEHKLGPEHRNIARKFFKDFQTRIGRYDYDDNFSRKYQDKEEELEGGSESYVKAYHSFINSKSTPRQFVEISKVLFKDLNWHQSYGGKAWTEICDAWLHLNEAKSLQSMFVYIDHIYDIQHNTGSVFNKVKAYKSVEQQFKQLLDDKAKMNNPLEIYHEVSPSMRKILPMAAKFKFGTDLEDFKKSRNSSISLKTNKNDFIQGSQARFDIRQNAADVSKVFTDLKQYMYNDQYLISILCYSMFYNFGEIMKLSEKEFNIFLQEIAVNLSMTKNDLFSVNNIEKLKDQLKKEYNKIKGWLETFVNSLKNVPSINLDGISNTEMVKFIRDTKLNLIFSDFDLNDKFENDLLDIIREHGGMRAVKFIRNRLNIGLLYAKYFYTYFHIKLHIEGKCDCFSPASSVASTGQTSQKITKIKAKIKAKLNDFNIINSIESNYVLPFVIYQMKLNTDEDFIKNELLNLVKTDPFWKSHSNIVSLFKVFFEELKKELDMLDKQPASISPWEGPIQNFNILISLFKKEFLNNNVVKYYTGKDIHSDLLIKMINLFYGIANTKVIEKIVKLLHTKLHSENKCNCGVK